MTGWLRAGSFLRMGRIVCLCVVLCLAGGEQVVAQAVTTTTVQGTVYLADGTPGSGTVLVSWPAFTTAANQQVEAGNTVVTVGLDGFLSVNLAPNAGSNPAGLYYTAVFHLSDGMVNTQYRRIDAAELFGILGRTVCESASRELEPHGGRALWRVSEMGGARMRMMNEFEAQVLSDLSVLKAQMTGLVGDGNCGRFPELERRVDRHEQNLQRAKGFMAAISVLFAVIEVMVEAFRRH